MVHIQKLKISELTYAKLFFELNPIKKSELKYYKGEIKGKSPHGIDNNVWKKAYNWAKRTNNLTIED